MATKVEIWNLALVHLGQSKSVQSETESSIAAQLCDQFYDICRQKTLRDANWPFATRTVELALVEEEPTDEWLFSYRYPAHCLRIQRIISGIRPEDRQSKVSYKIASDAGGLLVWTDYEDPSVEYTHDIDDNSQFDADFSNALSFLLAAYIAPSLTAGDPYGLAARAYQMYEQELSKALANAANEEQPDEEPKSDFERARE